MHKQLDPARNLVPPVGAPHILSRIFFFGKEKKKLLFKSTKREQHSGAAPLYTNEDLQLRLEKKNFMVLEYKQNLPRVVHRIYPSSIQDKIILIS